MTERKYSWGLLQVEQDKTEAPLVAKPVLRHRNMRAVSGQTKVLLAEDLRSVFSSVLREQLADPALYQASATGIFRGASERLNQAIGR